MSASLVFTFTRINILNTQTFKPFAQETTPTTINPFHASSMSLCVIGLHVPHTPAGKFERRPL